MTIWEYISFRKFVSIKNYNHTSDITKFQTLQRIQSMPTLSRVLFCRGIDESRDRFKHFMESEPRGKVGSFFDITRITWLYRHHTIRSLKCIKVKYWGDFLHIIILTKFQKNCSKFQNCDLRKFHDLPKIRNFCPPENVKFIFINKSFNFPHDWHRLSIWQSFRTNCSDKNFIMIASDR